MDNLDPEKLELHDGHDDEFDEGDEGAMDENHPMWRSERITLNSVGIDIGSSTSHLIFSRLTQGYPCQPYLICLLYRASGNGMSPARRK